MLLRQLQGRHAQPTAAIYASRTMQSTSESGGRAGYDGGKRRKGSKVHAAVDTLGNLLTLLGTPANEQDRDQVEALSAAVQDSTGQSVEIAFVDQRYTGAAAAEQADKHDIALVVVKSPYPKRGFVLLPRRWVMERTRPHYQQYRLDVQLIIRHNRADRIA